MKVLAISASPRKGNTEILLNTALQRVQNYGHEIKIVKPFELNISDCISCDACAETGECVINDQMKEIYQVIKKFHRIIIASPIFFFSVPGQLKLIIDRCQCFWYGKYILKKPIEEGEIKRRGLLILVGGMKKGEVGVTCAEATLKAFLRTISVSKHETLSFLGFDEPGSILKEPSAILKVEEATERLLLP